MTVDCGGAVGCVACVEATAGVSGDEFTLLVWGPGDGVSLVSWIFPVASCVCGGEVGGADLVSLTSAMGVQVVADLGVASCLLIGVVAACSLSLGGGSLGVGVV